MQLAERWLADSGALADRRLAGQWLAGSGTGAGKRLAGRRLAGQRLADWEAGWKSCMAIIVFLRPLDCANS